MPTLDQQLLGLGFDCAVGVPDSHLATLLSRMELSIPISRRARTWRWLLPADWSSAAPARCST